MNMFCFQCEQTAFGKGCTKVGICGKQPDTANLQDELTNAVIELAVCGEKSPENTDLIIEGLFTTVTNVNFCNNSIKNITEQIIEKINCDKTFDVKSIWNTSEDIRSLKSLILFGLRGMSAYAHHARILGYKCEEVDNYFYEALNAITKDIPLGELTALVLKTGGVNFKCMELLDKANTETYGQPEPTKVTTNIKKGPFIVVS